MLTSVTISANRTQRVSLIEHQHYCFLSISANIPAVLLLCKLQIAPWESRSTFPRKFLRPRAEYFLLWIRYFLPQVFIVYPRIQPRRISRWSGLKQRSSCPVNPVYKKNIYLWEKGRVNLRNQRCQKKLLPLCNAIIQCARINGEGFKYLQTQIAQVFFASGCLIIALTRWWIHNDVTVPTHTISFLMWLLLSGMCGFPLWTPQVSHIFFLSL